MPVAMAAPPFAGGGGADAAAAASSPPPTAAELGLPPWLDLCIVRGDNKLIASSREELSGRLKIRQLGGRADYPLGHIAHWAAKVVALVSGEDDGHSADYEGGGSEGDGSASAVDSLGAREEALLLLDDAVDLLDSEVEATRKEWGHPDDHSALIAYVTAYSHRWVWGCACMCTSVRVLSARVRRQAGRQAGKLMAWGPS